MSFPSSDMKCRTRQVSFSQINSEKKSYHPLPYREGVEYKVNPETGCWEWILPYKGDYPTYKGHGAHRFAYAIANKNYNPNVVCHRCDVKHCVNPAHLYEGTTEDNQRDRTYITMEQAVFITVLRQNKLPLGLIATTLNVSVSIVRSVVYGQHWITKTPEYKESLSNLENS